MEKNRGLLILPLSSFSKENPGLSLSTAFGPCVFILEIRLFYLAAILYIIYFLFRLLQSNEY
jgi:hypothetical protein